MNEMQLKINKMIDDIDKKSWKGKARHDMETTMIHLTEELGEISRQLYNEKTGRDNLNKENLSEEIADVVMLLNKLASLYDIDVESAVKTKLDVLKKRHNLN
jgi:NTP pyrophosphatase (non-canonical NTP hydrolase)